MPGSQVSLTEWMNVCLKAHWHTKAIQCYKICVKWHWWTCSWVRDGYAVLEGPWWIESNWPSQSFSNLFGTYRCVCSSNGMPNKQLSVITWVHTTACGLQLEYQTPQFYPCIRYWVSRSSMTVGHRWAVSLRNIHPTNPIQVVLTGMSMLEINPIMLHSFFHA